MKKINLLKVTRKVTRVFNGFQGIGKRYSPHLFETVVEPPISGEAIVKLSSFKLSKYGAGNEIRTRDLNLGKVALYQLSYSR